MSRLARNGTVEHVSRNQFHRREREQGNIHFPCSADHEQDWQPYPVDPYTLATSDTSNITSFVWNNEEVSPRHYPLDPILPIGEPNYNSLEYVPTSTF